MLRLSVADVSPLHLLLVLFVRFPFTSAAAGEGMIELTVDATMKKRGSRRESALFSR